MQANTNKRKIYVKQKQLQENQTVAQSAPSPSKNLEPSILYLEMIS